MVEPILHVILPILILLSFKPNLDKKLVFGLAILTILPDFDFIVGHRSLLHNLSFIIIFSLIIYISFKFIINKNNENKKTENKNAFYLSIFYLFSHLLLDIGSPGIPFFYPFSDKLFTVNFNLLTSSMNGIFNGVALKTMSSITLNPLIEATSVRNGPILTTFGLTLSIIIVIFLISSHQKSSR